MRKKLVGPAILCLGFCIFNGCDDSGQDCFINDHAICREGAIYSVDSCGVEGDKVRDCYCGCNDDFSGCDTSCICIPDCSDKECGDDGCQGSCGDCPSDTDWCTEEGLCKDDCAGRECGLSPTFGYDCGNCPGERDWCTPEGYCRDDCRTITGHTRECGPSPNLGISCGTCEDPETVCNEYGHCRHDCTGLGCGDISPNLGLTCTYCPGATEWCSEDGECLDDCAGLGCGDVSPNGGFECQACPGETEWCTDERVCEDDCAGRECGLSPTVGYDCGTCAGSTDWCRPEGVCEDYCVQQDWCSFVSVEAGSEVLCAITTAGSVLCWTEGVQPPREYFSHNAVSVTVGVGHACAAFSNGTVYCWGERNESGQLGDGTTIPSPDPVQVVGITSAVSVTAGDGHSCALMENGTAMCWGLNWAGELGAGEVTLETCLVHPCSKTPLLVADLVDITAIDAGGWNTCAITSDENLWCWGTNGYGQLGTEEYGDAFSPIQVSSIQNVEKISVGSRHNCAQKTDGSAWCWGDGGVGQMGVGGQSWPPEPVEVLDFGEVSGISANGFSTSAIGPAGSVWCWGSNEWGQVGSEDCRNTDEPHLVEGLTAITIATGEEFTAAIRADGSLWVWGCLTATSQFYPCFEPLPRPFH